MNDEEHFKKSLNESKSGDYQFGLENSAIVENIPELDSIKKILHSDELPSLQEVSDTIMEAAKKATLSEHCYVAYVDPENGDSVGISFSHMTGECEAYAEMGEARFPIRKDGTYGGLLGYSLDTGKSFYVRDPTSHPAAHGMPSGHVQVDQFLSVAVINEGDILGQIVLGNPEEDYTSRHLGIAGEIASTYGVALRKLLY